MRVVAPQCGSSDVNKLQPLQPFRGGDPQQRQPQPWAVSAEATVGRPIQHQQNAESPPSKHKESMKAPGQIT